MRKVRVLHFVRLLLAASLALLTVPLSGCLDSTETVPTQPGGNDATAVSSLFRNPAILAGPGGDIEVSLAVSDDGETILVCTHGGFEQPSPLYASTDAGKTFIRMDPQPNTDFNGDCDVSIGGDGSWFIVYDTVYSATVARSLDQGKTWRLTYVDAVPFGVVDRPWIHAVDQDRVYLVYGDLEAAMPAVDTFAFSIDGGLTFVHRVFAYAEPPQKVNNLAGKMIVYDEGQTIRVPLYRWNPNTPSGAGQVEDGPVFLEFAVSRDAGLTWRNEPVIGPLEGVPLQLATGGRGPDGTLYFSYTTPNRTDVGPVMLVYSSDEGESWSKPQVVAENQTFAGLPTAWVEGRPDGSATIAWMTRNDNNTVWQAAAARVHTADGFHVEFAGPIGGPGANTSLFEFLMVRHDASGRAIVAYPLLTGPDCLSAGSFPSTSGAIERSNQCIYVVLEDPLGAPMDSMQHN